MGTLTEQALQLIHDDGYMSPEESLDYLEQPFSHNTISRQLKRTLQDLGFEGDEDQMIQLLVERLAPLCEDISKAETEATRKYALKKLRQKVQRWFKNDTPMSRTMAFQCCFALGLDIQASVDLLRKGCFLNGFNMRDAEEVVYFFCLLHAYSYADAQAMLETFHQAPCVEIPEQQHGTRTLFQTVHQIDWESPDAFLQNFLIPNKQNFIGYSKTILAVYQRDICKLCYNIIRDHLEIIRLSDIVADDQTGKQTHWDTDPVLSSTVQYIQAKAAEDPAYADILAQIQAGKYAGNPALAAQVEQFIIDHREACKRDWREILSADMIFSEAMYGIPEVWHYTRKRGRQKQDASPRRAYHERRGVRDSSLFQGINVLSSFPRADQLATTNYPTARAMCPETRKIIILLEFLNYCYDFMRAPSDQLSYADFYDELTDVLSACQLAYLYPGDPFDWLILKSVYLFELSCDVYDYEEDVHPIEYFNEVIERSFYTDEEIEAHLL